MRASTRKTINPYPLNNTTNVSNLSFPDYKESLVVFKGKPFHCWDTEFLGIRDCCFNHMIGLPQKDFDYKPLFPYELGVYKAWKQHMHIWIKKATGLGISEFFLRMMLWLCLRDDKYQGCQMCIATGPNIDLTKKLIERMKNMLIDYPSFKFGKITDCILEVNKCQYRPTPTPKFILLDEADFFRIGEQEEVRHVSERYIAKSNPHIVMVSTPNNPDGLFEQIENEPPDQCLYHRMFLDYRLGLGTIYSLSDIDMAKQSPSFEREYDLKFGYGLGNVFLPQEIEAVITDKEIKYNPACITSIGVDPAFGSSKFGITILQLEDNILKILLATEYDHASYESMVNLLSKLRYQFKPVKIFVDGANPEFISSLKSQIGEATDYQRIIELANKQRADFEYRMQIVPVNINEHGKLLLERFQKVVSKKWILIPNSANELIQQMPICKVKEGNGNLDKDTNSSNTYDLIDSTRLALKVMN